MGVTKYTNHLNKLQLLKQEAIEHKRLEDA